MKGWKNKVEKPKSKEQEKTTTEEHVPGGGVKTKPEDDE